MVNTSGQRTVEANEVDPKKKVLVLKKIMSSNYLDKLIVNFKQAKIQRRFIVNNIEKGKFPPILLCVLRSCSQCTFPIEQPAQLHE